MEGGERSPFCMMATEGLRTCNALLRWRACSLLRLRCKRGSHADAPGSCPTALCNLVEVMQASGLRIYPRRASSVQGVEATLLWHTCERPIARLCSLLAPSRAIPRMNAIGHAGTLCLNDRRRWAAALRSW